MLFWVFFSRRFTPDQSPFGFCEETKLHSVQLLPVYQTGIWIRMDELWPVSRETWERKELLCIFCSVPCFCVIYF